MLNALEAFWMDYGALITMISAAIVLISTAYTIFKNNSISDKTADKVESKGQQLSSEHGKLSSEHGKLSSEHSNLEKDHEMIRGTLSTTGSQVADVWKTLAAVDARLAQTDADRKLNYANLPDAQKALVESAANVGRFSDAFLKISDENNRLKQENAQLQQQKAEIRQESQQLRQENARLRAVIQKQGEHIRSLETPEQGPDEDEDWER